MIDYSFCESIHASGISPWHIRHLRRTSDLPRKH